MKKYETVMVFSTAITEEETQALVEKFKNLIAKNGTVESVDDWGKRRLAYPSTTRTTATMCWSTSAASPISRLSSTACTRSPTAFCGP